MTYVVTGRGRNDAQLRYSEESLDGARYLAFKMRDNGVKDVLVFDGEGNVIGAGGTYKASKDHWRSSFKRP